MPYTSSVRYLFKIMDLSLPIILLALIGSFSAGFINTYAGNGSMITLTIMMEFIGLPANLANGSNRVGIFAQTVPSAWIFHKDGKINFRRDQKVIYWSVFGALIGVTLAIVVSNEFFRAVFKYLILVLFIAVLIRPKRWLQPQSLLENAPGFLRPVIYTFLGFYGGFIQMGMGVVTLIIFVLLEGRRMMEANGLKIAIVGIYTFVVLLIFAAKGLVDWRIGLLFAVGQTLGGTLASVLAVKVPNIDVWAYRLLVIMMIAAIIKVWFF